MYKDPRTHCILHCTQLLFLRGKRTGLFGEYIQYVQYHPVSIGCIHVYIYYNTYFIMCVYTHYVPTCIHAII